MLKIQILRLLCRATESETLQILLRNSYLPGPPGDSDVYSSVTIFALIILKATAPPHSIPLLTTYADLLFFHSSYHYLTLY